MKVIKYIFMALYTSPWSYTIDLLLLGIGFLIFQGGILTVEYNLSGGMERYIISIVRICFLYTMVGAIYPCINLLYNMNVVGIIFLE